ncbi:helix-turn-helix transcriptional regulator [Kibdelosporangium philippinense]|uniref:Helix-turn-helix transcriptional regulator n=1 Tax=Kibdelosporangium philippinense TaxID=211113 RepID=A0ABS8ZEU9_9PSEU|nr:helix-turn-helix transcriptional regulator [Kibdelosporangium philippinense]MCE7004362.1 helix-turn-helix transcriptional regulator [Kibdelosporangium philippinense]
MQQQDISLLEVITAADLRARTAAESSRSEFHWLLAVTGGSGVHEVDSAEYSLSTGSWLWVRPGPIHRWIDPLTYEATAVLFEPCLLKPQTLLAQELTRTCGPAHWLPDPSTQQQLLQVLRLLQFTEKFAVQVRMELWHSLLSVLLLLLGQVPQRRLCEPDGVFTRFHEAVERDYRHNHQVNAYATALGYSSRTLNRSAQAAVGMTAKEYIIQRIVLEAKRLLVYGDANAAEIAVSLGFSEPTNFGKFFERCTGMPPMAFRAAYRNVPL